MAKLTKQKKDAVTLTDIKVEKNKHGMFSFRLTYECCQSNGRESEVTMRVASPFKENSFTVGIDPGDLYCDGPTRLRCLRDEVPVFDMSEIETKAPDPVELSISEIEKKLGYPIKIVKEKD